MTDPSGKVTELTYDALGNVTDMTENGSRKTSYTYDAEGNQISETNALGQKTVYTYDAMNRLAQEISAGGKKTQYTYNKNSDLTAITDRNGHTTRFEYDGNGNLTRLSDAAGRQSAYGYDKNDRLTEAVTGSGAEETAVTYTYDAVGNLASQTDGNGNITAWEYDRLGNVTKEKDALGQVEAYEYDKEARLSKVIRPDGNTITYDYNRLDQLLQTAYSKEEEGAVLYGYDRDGRRVSMSDLTGISTYTYDEGNRVTGVRSGDRLRAVTENGRLLQSALYDGDDNRVFVANRKVVTESKKNGRTAGGAKERWAEDDAGEQSAKDAGAGEDADDRKTASGTEKDGKIRQARDSDFWYGFFQNLSQGFALTDYAVSDALHRFWDGLAEWCHVHLLGDRPDSDGIVRNPVKELPEPEGLTQPGGSGGLGESGEAGTEVAGRNRLEALYSQTLIPYGVSEKERDTYELTYFINDINRAYTDTLMEYDPDDGTLGRTYEYGTERLSYCDEEAGEFYAYAYDGRGNVANLTGEAGESVVSYTYDIYGAAEGRTAERRAAEGGTAEGGAEERSIEEGTGSSAENALRNPYLYRGEYTDCLTGNQYLRARYYRPATGSFLTRDPYQGDPREPASLNRYTYAGNDPIVRVG